MDTQLEREHEVAVSELVTSNEDATSATTARRPEQGADQAPADEERRGELAAGRYELINRLPWDSTCEIYRALDRTRLKFGTDPYLGVLFPPVSFSNDLPAVARCLQLTRAWHVLNHPHILAVHEFRRDQEVPFVALDVLPGGALADRLKAGPLPLPQAMTLVATLGHALAEAHAHGLVHGRVVPTAIAVDGQASAKWLDPGITEMLLGAEARSQTEIYASPEVLQGNIPDARADVFAFAGLAYEMLTGQHVFDRLTAGEAGRSGWQLKSLPPLNKALMRAFRRALAFDPGRRTPDIMTFLYELDGGRQRRPVAWALAAAMIPALWAGSHFLLRTAPSTLVADVPVVVKEGHFGHRLTPPKLRQRKTDESLQVKNTKPVSARAPVLAASEVATSARPVSTYPVAVPALPVSHVEALTDIDQLLNYAQERIASKHYAGFDSAAEALLKILQSNPLHAEARRTLSDIVSYYAQQGRVFIAAHDWDRAYNMLNVAKTLSPGNADLQSAMLELSSAEVFEDERPTIGGKARERYTLLR